MNPGKFCWSQGRRSLTGKGTTGLEQRMVKRFYNSFQNGFLVNWSRCLGPLFTEMQVSDHIVRETPPNHDWSLTMTLFDPWNQFKRMHAPIIIFPFYFFFQRTAFGSVKSQVFFTDCAQELLQDVYLPDHDFERISLNSSFDSFNVIRCSNCARTPRPGAIFNIFSFLKQFYAPVDEHATSSERTERFENITFFISHLSSAITVIWFSSSDHSMMKTEAI